MLELANAFGVKVLGRLAVENEEENNGKDCDVHQQHAYRMQGADDEVEGDPGDEEPAGPVAATEHEEAGDDLQETREVNVPVADQVAATRHSPQ
jgi:hypothetical protein